ncbi:MAG: hypothetical protein R3Y32_02875 [Bacillota bacterium]
MKEILLTLAGVVVLSVVCDVMISGGNMKKYTRLFIGITVSTILAVPLVNFLSSEELTIPTLSYDYGYIEVVESQYTAMLNQSAQIALLERGITASVEIAYENGEIAEVVIICQDVETAEKANEIGYATMEILSIPLWKIKIRAS